MALARQTAEQGIGDNDLKRLQRQFDSNKATFVNIDQKQRFMKGEYSSSMYTTSSNQRMRFTTAHKTTAQLMHPGRILQDSGTLSWILIT